MTIWDGGGTDTYDLSNYSTGVTIDLRPGEWTSTSAVQLANLGNGNMARGNVANALLFGGDTRSLIENAVGGAGNDTLIANQAVNRLTGGAGSDVFRFNSVGDSGPGALADTIADFLSGTDRIDLSGIDANSNTAGDDAFSFIGAGAFTGVAGQLRYEGSGSSIRLLADVNGDSVADFELVVMSPVISQPDFIL
jgi:serralysin